MTLENVWKALKEGEWESRGEIEAASGVDEDTVTRAINFLERWNYVDTRHAPELQVRRKPNLISPVETFKLLQSIAQQKENSNRAQVIAERVACRICGGRQLHFVGRNQVECDACRERQWHTLKRRETPITEDEGTLRSERPGLLGRILLRLGRPQKVFTSNIPKTTQYFWFRCTNCKKTSADYPHGHSRYLTCQQCQTRNQFW